MNEYAILMAVVIMIGLSSFIYGISEGMATIEILVAIASFLLTIMMLLTVFVGLMVAYIVLDIAANKTTMWHYFRNDKNWLPVLREAQRIVDEKKVLKESEARKKSK